MSNRKFFILFGIIVGIGLLLSIVHVIYLAQTYPNASIVQFIAREWWI